MYKKGEIQFLEKIAKLASRVAGSSLAFIFAVGVIAVWMITGPIFNFSDTWQLVINTGTTIITFLMVFLIQRAQNKDSMALHLKLNELIASIKGPSNRLIDIEDLSEEELKVLQKYYRSLSELAGKESDLSVSHSIEEAWEAHRNKSKSSEKRKVIN